MTRSPSESLSQGGKAVETTGFRASEDEMSQTVTADSVGLLVIDSCHSTWLFDPPALRFRRILKGLDVDPSLAGTDWRPYARLELSDDSGAFMVVLNEAGTRRIR